MTATTITGRNGRSGLPPDEHKQFVDWLIRQKGVWDPNRYLGRLFWNDEKGRAINGLVLEWRRYMEGQASDE